MVKLINVNVKNVWLYIEQLKVVDEITREIKTKEKSLCYFKFTEPSQFVLGELIIKNDFPKLFDSIDNAINFTQIYIKDNFLSNIYSAC